MTDAEIIAEWQQRFPGDLPPTAAWIRANPGQKPYLNRGAYRTEGEYNTAGVGIYGDTNTPGQAPLERGFGMTPEERFRFDQGNRNLGFNSPLRTFLPHAGQPIAPENSSTWSRSAEEAKLRAAGTIGSPAYTQPSIIPAASPAPSASGVGGFGASRQQELPYWMKKGFR